MPKCFLLTLSPLSCSDIDEDVQSVKQFSSELIVQAVVRCLRVIDPSVGNGLSPMLPPGMSARFRVGMSLAQACQVRDTNFCVLNSVTARGHETWAKK